VLSLRAAGRLGRRCGGRSWRLVAGLGLAAGGVSLAVTGCASSAMQPTEVAAVVPVLATAAAEPPRGGATPDDAVQKFLAALRAVDQDAMLALFGTAAGPVDPSEPAGEWRERVALMAQLLQHDAYEPRPRTMIAGSAGAAWRVGVDLRAGRRHHDDVGFPLVRAGEGQWLIERVELERLMRAPEPVR